MAEAKPVPGPSAAELTRVIQVELYRLGCGTSEANGKWSSGTREGLRKFNAFMRVKLDMNEPTNDTIAALQKRSDRVCPVVCGRGFVARANTCVAIPKPEPVRKVRHAERRHVPRVRQEQPAAAQPQQPVAASGPPMMGGPMGGGFFFMGGFGRHH
jgi:hypothetical protein